MEKQEWETQAAKKFYKDKKALERHAQEYSEIQKASAELGVKLAGMVPSQSGKLAHVGSEAETAAYFLYGLGRTQPDIECEIQFLEWTMNRYWALKVEERLEDFTKAWVLLRDSHKRKSKALTGGDDDFSIWAPTAPNGVRVIIIQVHCAAREDNTYIFRDSGEKRIRSFHARTCWPRITKNSYNLKRTDWDAIDKPSLRFYEEHEYQPKYGDARDKGYGFSYQQIMEHRSVDGGFTQTYNIRAALRELDTILGSVK